MALTYGFYNSHDGDRVYDAETMGSIFDGIINDGVYQSVGNTFNVSLAEGMTLNVDTGRAWFNNTWTLNDSVLQVTVPAADVLDSRIDAVVLEINKTDSVRANSIFVVKGVPGTSPQKPVLTNTQDIHQYPLAYVTVGPNVTALTQGNIASTVGTGECPFVISPIQTMEVEALTQRVFDYYYGMVNKTTNIVESRTNTVITENSTEALVTTTITDSGTTTTIVTVLTPTVGDKIYHKNVVINAVGDTTVITESYTTTNKE